MNKIKHQKKSSRIETLYRLSRILISTTKLKSLLRLTLNSILEDLEGDAGSILLLDKRIDKLRIYVSKGIKKEIARETIVSLGEEIAGVVAQKKKPYLIHNGEFPPEFKGIRVRPEIHSSIVVPLIFLDKVIGVICINRIKTKKGFSKEDLEMVWLFAGELAQAISNAIFYKEMEERVKERTRKLERVNRTLLELSKKKEDFLEDTCHELKGPITSIRSYSEILLKEEGILDKKKRHEFSKIIHEEAKRLETLVRDLLKFIRIGRKEIGFKIRKVSIKKIIEEAVKEIKPLAEKKGIKVEVFLQDKLPTFRGNRERILEVMDNLLDNAVKFTGKRGRITVKAKKNKESLHVSVEDTGIGIRKEDLERVFERFFKVSYKGRPVGTGLGLSIAKEIITQHNGKIWVESEIGKGTAFHFILPL